MPRIPIPLLLAVLLTLSAGCASDDTPAAGPVASGPTEAEARIAEANARAAEAEARLAEAQAEAARSGASGGSEAAQPSSRPAPAPAPTPRPAPAPSEPFTANVDLTGPWMLCTTTQRSNLARYRGLRLCYELTLTQTGGRISASGRKVTEALNDGPEETLSGSRATPITVSGTIDNSLRMRLTTSEQGARRNTTGTLNLSANDGMGGYAGTFTTTAANSSGQAQLINMR